MLLIKLLKTKSTLLGCFLMNYTICFPGLFMMTNVTQKGEKNREVNGLFSDFAAYTH